MEVIEYVYQKNFLEIGYFVAVAATIMKFYSEKFKDKPAYTMVLINDLAKLTFVSLSVIVGFSLIVLVNRNYEAIANLQPPTPPEPGVIYEDRVSQAISRFNSEIDLSAMGANEAAARATQIYFEIFGDELRDRPFDGIMFRLEGGAFVVWCGESASPSTLGCIVGERG